MNTILYPNNCQLVMLQDIDQSDRERKDMGDVEELASSIRKIGLIHPPLVTTVNGLPKLVAGGRRLAAFKLLEIDPVPVLFRENLSEADIKEMELEENFKRKKMTWQESTLNIYKCHRLKSNEASKDFKDWGVRHTGELLGVSHAHISHTIVVAQRLLASDLEITQCASLTDAYQLLLKRKENEALAKVDRGQSISSAVAGTVKSLRTSPIIQVFLDDDDVYDGTSSAAIDALLDNSSTLPTDPAFFDQQSYPLSTMLREGDCLQVMKEFADGSFDHIVTDPPYGVNMDSFEQMKNIDVVVDTHDVDQNISMFRPFLEESYRLLKDKGFCVFWYDLDHHEKLQSLAKEVGFRVQRWPITWHKIHNCKNNSAAFNFTKNTEWAMVLRKGNATLIKPQSTSVVLADGNVDRKLYLHPFAKPAAVWNFIYEAIAFRGQSVLDPFAGEMSSLRAALNNGLVPFGIEITPELYHNGVENIKKLLSEIHNGKAIFH